MTRILVVPKNTTHLSFIESITLAPTRGTATLANAGNIFTGGVNPKFEDWGTNVVGKDTPEQIVDIYEPTQCGNFRTLFGSFPGSLGSVCLSQGQIKELARSHHKLLLKNSYLPRNDAVPWFLFEVNRDVCVANFVMHCGELRTHLFRLTDDFVWGGSTDLSSRLIVPRLDVMV